MGVAANSLGLADSYKLAFAAFWGALTVVIVVADRRTPYEATALRSVTSARFAHGGIAIALILVFLGPHIANHLFGLVGQEAHTSVLKMLRHVYRGPIVEPLLLTGFAFQIATGLYLARAIANRVQAYGSCAAALLASLIILGMCGLRVHFE